jgi:hypothetical protein
MPGHLGIDVEGYRVRHDEVDKTGKVTLLQGLPAPHRDWPPPQVLARHPLGGRADGRGLQVLVDTVCGDGGNTCRGAPTGRRHAVARHDIGSKLRAGARADVLPSMRCRQAALVKRRVT